MAGSFMTLVLTRASKNYALQVTDRLVTYTQDCRPFDTLANKNIVYCARNAIVTIGYTGLAYRDEMPTDQWIVEKLTGKRTVYFDGKPAAWCVGPRKKWLDIGLSMRMLKTEFENAATGAVRWKWKSAWKARYFELSVAGWQWSRRGRRFRPLLLSLGKERGSTSFELVEQPCHRYFRDDKITGVPQKRFVYMLQAAPTENIPASDLRGLRLGLEDKRPDEAETIFVNCIRNAAERLSVVGWACMSIVLLPPPVARGGVRYVPATPSEASLVSETETIRLPAAFSPWLVGRNEIRAPSIMERGNSSVRLGFYEIAMESPDLPERGVRSYWSSLERPAAPRLASFASVYLLPDCCRAVSQGEEDLSAGVRESAWRALADGIDCSVIDR